MTDFKIPFQDFQSPYEELAGELDEAYQRFMRSGWYVLGNEVSSFEEEYATYCEAKYCVGVGSGLDALTLALRALNCGNGDEVIVPSNTYIATWLAITHAGAKPAPVEPDPSTFNINPSRIEEAITSKTKAILAVNLYGQPCDYDPIIATARKHNIKVVIDNAQAQGARYNGRRVGGIADIECHSFYPSKNLGAYGEAGAITTNHPDLADKIRVLRNYGSRIRYENEVVGFNSRLDELQAAFLRIKLRKLDEWNALRSAVAAIYTDQLSALDSQLFRNSSLRLLPMAPEWAAPVWHLFVIRHPERIALQKHLSECGIQTIIHYPIPPHLSGAYAVSKPQETSAWKFPIAEQLANEVLSLPIGPHMPFQDAIAVCDSIGAFQASNL